MVYPHSKSDCIVLCECSREVWQLDFVQDGVFLLWVYPFYAGRTHKKQLDGAIGPVYTPKEASTLPCFGTTTNLGDGEKVKRPGRPRIIV